MPQHDQTSLLNALPFAAAILDKRGAFQRANRAWGNLPGGGLVTWARGLNADTDTEAAIVAGLGTLLAGQSARFEWEFNTATGWWYLHATISDRGLDDGVLLILRDITPRRQAELALAEREAELLAFLETVPDAMIVIDARGVIQSFSNAAARQFGYAAADVVGRNVSMLMPSPYREAHDSYLARYRDTGERRIIGIGRVVVGRRQDGTTFPMELQVGEVARGGQRQFIGFVRDLTEKQTSEARLQELQTDYLHESRLHSLGEMAAQLAHELNQPLAATANYLKAALLLLDQGADADPTRLRQALDLAAQQTMRAGDIIRQLREFVARGTTEMRAEPIAKLIQEASALALVGARQRGIDTRIEIVPDLPPARADRVQIQQVLLNLMRNVIEAMEASPRRDLTVRAEMIDAQLRVSVADTGGGIAPEIAARLFQPFVTTKTDGMGIGLSTCRAIIEAHGGRLWWEAVATEGTVFRFTLVPDKER